MLSRQWKNAIYTPILIEYNLRSKGFKNLYNTNLDPILEGTDAESESSNDGDDLDAEDVEFDGIYFKFKATIVTVKSRVLTCLVLKHMQAFSDCL